MSLESAPNLSYDLPPTDERKGKTKAESDRYLRKLIISHRAKLTRYPAGTMAASRQKNVVGIPVRASWNAAPFAFQTPFVGPPLAAVPQKCTARFGEQLGRGLRSTPRGPPRLRQHVVRKN
jgi:hypothetical protein